MRKSHRGKPRAILAVPFTATPSNATEATPLLSGQRNPYGPPSQTQAAYWTGARERQRQPSRNRPDLTPAAAQESRDGRGPTRPSARSASAAASSTSGAQTLAAARPEPGARPADADHRDEGSRAVTDGSRDGHEADLELVHDLRPSPAPCTCDLSLDPRHVHDRLAREASGPHLGDPCSTFLLTELGQDELAGGRCVQGHVGAHPADDAKVVRCVQLGDDLHLGPAGGDAEQRRLAGAVAKPAQRPAGRLDHGAPWIGQPGQPEQLVTDDPAVGRLGDEAAVEQRPECAADGGPGLACDAGERRGRNRARGLRDRDEDVHRPVERVGARDSGLAGAHMVSSLDQLAFT